MITDEMVKLMAKRLFSDAPPASWEWSQVVDSDGVHRDGSRVHFESKARDALEAIEPMIADLIGDAVEDALDEHRAMAH